MSRWASCCPWLATTSMGPRGLSSATRARRLGQYLLQRPTAARAIAMILLHLRRRCCVVCLLVKWKYQRAFYTDVADVQAEPSSARLICQTFRGFPRPFSMPVRAEAADDGVSQQEAPPSPFQRPLALPGQAGHGGLREQEAVTGKGSKWNSTSAVIFGRWCKKKPDEVLEIVRESLLEIQHVTLENNKNMRRLMRDLTTDLIISNSCQAIRALQSLGSKSFLKHVNANELQLFAL